MMDNPILWFIFLVCLLQKQGYYMRNSTALKISFSSFIFSFLMLSNALIADERPNIVYIISDDQSWTDYSFMGHSDIKTPHLDKLASESVVFKRGYVPTALCRPALATFATGLYSHQNKVTGNDPAFTEANKAHEKKTGKKAKEILISYIDTHMTIPRLLRDNGYLTFQSGKWWEGSFQRGGFTHGMTKGYPNPGGRHGDKGLEIGRKGLESMKSFMDLAQNKKKPFYIWYAPFLPHTPHNPPERLLSKYKKDGRPLSIAKYYAMCDWFDETCGEVLGELDKRGLKENTLVVYVTDNGWIQNPKGNGYVVRSKRSPYEGGTRTPIMFRWPKMFKAAERSELCTSLDIAPTALAAAGVKSPTQLPGLNLLPNLKKQSAISRDTIFGESFAHDIADIEKPEASLLYRWVIEGDYKLLLTYDGRMGRMKYPAKDSEPKLYNLIEDPHEKVNLASKQKDKVASLAKKIDNWYPLKERKQGLGKVSVAGKRKNNKKKKG